MNVVLLLRHFTSPAKNNHLKSIESKNPECNFTKNCPIKQQNVANPDQLNVRSMRKNIGEGGLQKAPGKVPKS